jgi:LCP family protein required for cell wall assembly
MVLYRFVVVLSALIVLCYAAWRILVPTPHVAPPDLSQTQQQEQDSSAQTPPEEEGLKRKDRCYTFLLLGTDDGNGNADTLMVGTYDVQEQKVGVVSIPRDTIVDRDWSRYPKINGAYGGGGGVARVRAEVSRMLGIPIDFYIKVDIRAFVDLVNEVGGVDFDVPVDMNYDDPAQNLSIHYKKGLQHLNGRQALEVVRFRHNNDMSGYSDVGRTQTQQALLTAVAKKVLSWGSVPKIANFVDIFADHVDTDLTVSDMVYFATQALYLDLDGGVTTKTLEGRGDATYKGYTWCYELDKEKTLADINTMLNPYTTPVTEEMAHIMKADSYST